MVSTEPWVCKERGAIFMLTSSCYTLDIRTFNVKGYIIMFNQSNESEWREINIDINIDTVADKLKNDFTEEEIRNFCAMAAQEISQIPEKDKMRYQLFKGLTGGFSKKNYEALNEKFSAPVSPTASTPLLYLFGVQSNSHQQDASKKHSRCCPGLFG